MQLFAEALSHALLLYRVIYAPWGRHGTWVNLKLLREEGNFQRSWIPCQYRNREKPLHPVPAPEGWRWRSSLEIIGQSDKLLHCRICCAPYCIRTQNVDAEAYEQRHRTRGSSSRENAHAVGILCEKWHDTCTRCLLVHNQSHRAGDCL